MKIDIIYIGVIALIGLGFTVGKEVYFDYQESQKEYKIEKQKKSDENKKLTLGFFENCIQDSKSKVCCTMLKQSYWEYLNTGWVKDETKQLTDKACSLTIVKDIKQENGIIDGVKTGIGISLGNQLGNHITK